MSSCTKLVSNAASAIEMEAAVEATRKERLAFEYENQPKANGRVRQRTLRTHDTRLRTRQRPVERVSSHTSTNRNSTRPEDVKTTPLPGQSSTRRRSSATAQTQSSASKSTTKATGSKLTIQSKTRLPLKGSNTVSSEYSRTAMKKVNNQSASSEETKLEDGMRPKVRSRTNSSPAL
jgi:hypothetical protein